jgi:hypothetical protein
VIRDGKLAASPTGAAFSPLRMRFSTKISLPVGQWLSDLALHRARMTTRTDSRIDHEISEIDGYLELGMEEQALDVIGTTLSKRVILEEEFSSCVFGLLQSEHLENWIARVQDAYRRLNSSKGDQVRSAMLNFYFSIGDSAEAFTFFPDRSTKFFDAWTMMQVCLDLGKLSEAKKVARYCSGHLKSAADDFTKASMADALAAYYLRVGEPEQALQVWGEAPVEPAFLRQRLCGIVKARLLQALQAANAGMAALTEAEKDLQVPENTAMLVTTAETELKDLQARITRLLPNRA